jgi:hypothetical protein
MLLLVGTFIATHRRPLIGVVTVLPVGLVLALTFGTMALTGIPLNPVTATLAALSIGIGVPFTIHVTSRFLEERSLPYDGTTAIRRTVAQTGGALAGSRAHDSDRVRDPRHIDAQAVRAARLRHRLRDRLLARRRGARAPEHARAVGPARRRARECGAR